MAIRVVLVDDVPDVRRLVKTAMRFRGDFDVVGEAGDGTEAVAVASALQPDIVVLDLGLPDIAGREVLIRIRERSPRTKVVVFSGTETADRDWIEQRVEGYVLKDADLEYLLDLLAKVGRESDRLANLQLDHDLASVLRARRFVRRTFNEWDLGVLLDDALVVVSELVTNAITHAGSPCLLRLSLNSASVRVEVLDDGVGTPEPQPSSSTKEHGRGLHLVAALTAAWGMELIPNDGKLVWAELPRTG